MSDLAQRIADLADRLAAEFNAVRDEASLAALTQAAMMDLALDGELTPGKVYVLTDEDRVVVAFTSTSYADMPIGPVAYGGPPAQIVAGGAFNDASGWTVSGAGASITGGQLVFGAGGGLKRAYWVAGETLVQDQAYAYSFDIVSRTSGLCLLSIGADGISSGTSTANFSAPGNYSGVIELAGLIGQDILIFASSGAVLTVDNVSVTRALNSLVLSEGSISENSPAGTVVGAFSRTFEGSVLSLSDDAGGLFEVVGHELRVAGGLNFETASSHEITVVETRPGVANSPRSTDLTVTVTNALDGTLGPELNPDPEFNNPGLWTCSNEGGNPVPEITGGKAIFTVGGSIEIPTTDTLGPGIYRVTWTIDDIVGECEVCLGYGTLPSTIAQSVAATYAEDVDCTETGTPPGADVIRIATSGAGFSAQIDNISVKLVTFP